MDNKVKVIAFHLPQFHQIPENDKWWGEGFTEWTNVKAAKKYYDEQQQPKIPLGDNYYNLLDSKVLEWQAKLAMDYDIYGFCFYHYWFNGKMLLEKPVELFRKMDDNKKCHYCICWANEDWTKAWADKRNETIIRQKYGDKKEWYEHFEYLLTFFKDDKYIKVKEKPLMVIYRPELINDLGKMLDYWNQLAIENGFKGLCFAYQQYSYLIKHGEEENKFDYNIEYQPSYAVNQMYRDNEKASIKGRVYSKLPVFMQKLLSNISEIFHKKNSAIIYDYDDVWKHILSTRPSSDKAIPGAFVDFDNSPRRKEKCTFFTGVTSEKFSKYIKMQIKNAKQKYSSEFLFVFAWNEWGENGYLEPDEQNGYKRLEAIRKALETEDI